MEAVFSHDHVFYVNSGKFYTSGSLKSEVIKRYTSIFDKVNMLTRQKQSEDVLAENAITLDSSNLEFTRVPDFKNIRNSILRIEGCKIIRQAVARSDFLIARLPSSIGEIAIRYARKYQKPYLIELVGCPWDALWNYGSLLGKLLAPFAYLRTKGLVRNSEFVMYVSNEFLQRRYPTKGKSIGCSDVSIPVPDINVLQNRLEKVRSRKEGDPLILGTAAAIDVKYKGQRYVIEALSRLVKLGFNGEYHLAGGGSKDYLTHFAQKCGVIDRVKFLGSVPHDEMFNYFDKLDIYIQPSKQEGLPRAVVEAMSRGCPVIGSRTGGIPELLNSEFVFANGSVDEIVDKVQIMLKNEIAVLESMRNFKKASEFHQVELEGRRTAFMNEAVRHAKS